MAERIFLSSLQPQFHEDIETQMKELIVLASLFDGLDFFVSINRLRFAWIQIVVDRKLTLNQDQFKH